jgi:hypothetical protein
MVVVEERERVVSELPYINQPEFQTRLNSVSKHFAASTFWLDNKASRYMKIVSDMQDNI